MPTFSITPSTTDTIRADDKGYAEVIYTVTNTSARPVRGIAKVKPLDQTKQEWLKLKGEPERDFAAAATQQYIVAFEGPVLPPTADANAGASAGAAPAALPSKYPFRLDVAVATNMDEDFTEGPVVTVQAAIGVKKKSFPFWIIPIAAVVLIGIAIGLFFLLRPSNVRVPNVVGKSLDDARAELETADLVAVEEETQVTNNAPAGQVIDQTPQEGENVREGSEIRLVVEGAQPLVTVPDVVKRLLDDATQRMTDAGLTVVTVATPMTAGFQINQVVTQKPGPNEQAPPGSSVELTVAAEKLVAVPDVRFNPLALAKQKLAAVGLVAEEQTPELAPTNVAAGNIKSQNPQPGVQVPEKSPVKLVVAATPTQVPQIKGKKIAEAQLMLQQRGLGIIVFGTYNQANASTVLITGQSPAAFANAAKGSPVVAFVPCKPGDCKWFTYTGTHVKSAVSATSSAIQK